MTIKKKINMEPENKKDRLEELLLDNSFREYVEANNDVSEAFWKEWILEHPESSDEINKAALVNKILLNAKKSTVSVDKEESLKLLIKQIDLQQKGSLIFRLSSQWLRIAAVAMLFLTVAITWFFISRDFGIKNTSIAFNELVVPLGEKARITLSDGTTVWINSDSKLKFPEKFGPDSREVFLEGEAFFDVTKRGLNAFIVHTRLSNVKVLGTAFNVKCYPLDDKTQTTVVRGLVEVQGRGKDQRKVLIKPNEMLTINDTKVESQKTETRQTLVLSTIESKNITSWKDQMLTFTGESFDDLALKMERWFNVAIVIQDEKLKTERFRGTFSHNETVYQVLEAIKITMPITYNVKNDTIYIKAKK